MGEKLTEKMWYYHSNGYLSCGSTVGTGSMVIDYCNTGRAVTGLSMVLCEGVLVLSADAIDNLLLVYGLKL